MPATADCMPGPRAARGRARARLQLGRGAVRAQELSRHLQHAHSCRGIGAHRLGLAEPPDGPVWATAAQVPSPCLACAAPTPSHRTRCRPCAPGAPPPRRGAPAPLRPRRRGRRGRAGAAPATARRRPPPPPPRPPPAAALGRLSRACVGRWWQWWRWWRFVCVYGGAHNRAEAAAASSKRAAKKAATAGLGSHQEPPCPARPRRWRPPADARRMRGERPHRSASVLTGG